MQYPVQAFYLMELQELLLGGETVTCTGQHREYGDS